MIDYMWDAVKFRVLHNIVDYGYTDTQKHKEHKGVSGHGRKIE